MALDRSLRLELDPQARPETMPLRPEEYFVLSRVQGQLTVGELIAGSGLGTAAAEQLVERLLELGALRRAGEPAPAPSVATTPPRRRQSTQELRVQAEERRRRVLQQQLVASRRSTPTPVPFAPEPVGDSSQPSARGPATGEVPVVAEPDDGPVVSPVSADDPRLDPTLGIGLDDQRWLLALEDRVDELTPFEWLGLRPTDDLKVIRGAFRDSSRRLHPDAYKGRDLGRYRSLLSSLFARAKAAHAALQYEEVRNPLVEAERAEQVERQRRAEQQEAARKAAEELRRRREEQEAELRRAEREVRRAERERERLVGAVKTKVAEHLLAADEAEASKSYASAANNLRLALQLDPSDEALRERWEAVRSLARHQRAKDAFKRATTMAEGGYRTEAIPLFLEAAESDPTVEHLAHAADAVREQDPPRARDLALAALRGLVEPSEGPASLRASVVADLRLMIGRAFLAAGQLESAAEQARLVQRVRPGDPQARALLNSAKVT
ncbi:tetratricopeptide repeat protein [Paraliomyxa miuraensis]|uniref:hypothetical protein n=1 Tax=Paraliomyxa miuraensis TaxID=376150 RepID=UPI00224CC414|nr:hypothetical protein [Paraliomyxa miuraensis]MCX4242387.1 hypothetical protein [Paraliomyxa miuraensis]